MKLSRFVLIAALAVPMLCFGQKKEYVELQRDMASLQDEVHNLERTVSENNGKTTTLLQQVIDNVSKLTTSLAVLDESMKQREQNLSAPLASSGAKVDQMATEFQNLRASVDDLNARMGKLEQSIVDLGNTMKVIQAPPAAPAAPGGGPGAQGVPPPQGTSAEGLYENAMRDKDSGNYDVAEQEFSDYLRYFGTTDAAPNAQYYIGEIEYNRKDYEGALKAFDLVLEKYPENNKTLDATYMKGMTLVRMGQRTKGAAEFREVIRRQPRSELASKAKAQLNSLGLSVTAKPAAHHS